MTARHPTLRSRVLACLTTLAVVQGWIVAPYVDVARDHDPILHTACPTAAHIEAPIDAHGVLGCILQVAATLVGPASVPPVGPSTAIPAADSGLHLPVLHPVTTDGRRLPPSRAPPALS